MRTLGLAQAARLADFLPSVLFILLLTRALGPSGYASYALHFMAAFLVSALLPPSLQDLFGRHLLAGQLVARSVLALGVKARLPFTVLGGALLTAALTVSTAGADFVLVVATLAAFATLEATSFSQAAAGGLLSFRVLLGWRAAGRLSTLALALAALAAGGLTPATALASLALGNLVTALGTLRGVWPTVRSIDIGETARAQTVWRFGLNSWLATVLTIGLGTQKDVILLGVMGASSVTIGVYAAATMLTTQLTLVLTGGWIPAALPMLASVGKDKDQFRLRWCQLVVVWALVVAAPFAMLAVVAPFLSVALFGNAFADAAGPIVVFSIGYCLTTFLGGAVNQLALYASNHSGQVLMARAVALAANFVLALALIPSLGAIGAAAATAVAVLLVFALELALLRRAESIVFPLRRLTPILGPAISAGAAGIAASAAFGNGITTSLVFLIAYLTAARATKLLSRSTFQMLTRGTGLS